MLPARSRMRQPAEFRAALRGRRAGARRLVVAVSRPAAVAADAVPSDVHSPVDIAPARVGFAVPRSVGTSVVRTRVSRRLRHLVRDRLPSLPDGALVVVRALPPAAGATSAELGADLDEALARALRRRSA